jgi:hypothetical protein
MRKQDLGGWGMLILARHYVAFLVRMFATPEQDFEVLDEHFSGCFGAVHLSNAKPLILISIVISKLRRPLWGLEVNRENSTS